MFFSKHSLLLLVWLECQSSHAFTTSPLRLHPNSHSSSSSVFAEQPQAKVVSDESASDETSADNPQPQVKLIECPCDQDDMPFYTLGVNLAMQIGGDMGKLLTDEEIDFVAQGFGEHLKGTLTSQGLDGQTILQQFGGAANVILQERTEKLAEENKQAGQDAVKQFLKENEKAVQTESGLVYLETKEGEGETPKEESTIEFHYHGMLTDGTVVDSSKLRGQSQTLLLQQCIPGMREAMLKMKAGGTATIMCPPDLAYGDAGAGNGVIPGGSTLTFEVELVQVVDPDAAP